jgi:hypothetical protein
MKKYSPKHTAIVIRTSWEIFSPLDRLAGSHHPKKENVPKGMKRHLFCNKQHMLNVHDTSRDSFFRHQEKQIVKNILDEQMKLIKFYKNKCWWSLRFQSSLNLGLWFVMCWFVLTRKSLLIWWRCVGFNIWTFKPTYHEQSTAML